MHIQHLRIDSVRNLTAVDLPNLAMMNVFFGDNGSGKTSILEAIHILVTGRSFRTNSAKQYIQSGQQQAVIFAQSDASRIGMQKMLSGEQHIKVNGQTVLTQSQLALLVPLQHIEPQSINILDLGSKPRRQLLDWLLFHIDADFYPTWLQYMRVLKQRNALLKQQNVSNSQLSAWDEPLAEFGEKINLQRRRMIQRWQPYFKTAISELLPDIAIELEYIAGYPAAHTLLEQLQQHVQRDKQRGFTEYGPHRADLRLKTGLGKAEDVLSRGQKKQLIIALKLSQIAMLHGENRQTVVLLDDFNAELDPKAQQRLIQRLSQLGSQVFLTTLEPATIKTLLAHQPLDCQFYALNAGQVS